MSTPGLIAVCVRVRPTAEDTQSSEAAWRVHNITKVVYLHGIRCAKFGLADVGLPSATLATSTCLESRGILTRVNCGLCLRTAPPTDQSYTVCPVNRCHRR